MRGFAVVLMQKYFLGELVSNWGEKLGHTMSIVIFWEPRVRG